MILNFKSKFLFLTFIFSPLVYSNINDYIYPFSNPSFSNYGTLGLLQMPSARMHEEGTLGFSWTNNDPYLRGSLVAYPFSWFEASYQYVDVKLNLLVEAKHIKIRVLMPNLWF